MSRTLAAALTAALLLAAPAFAQDVAPPEDDVPANVTGNARTVWKVFMRANELIGEYGDRPLSDPARIANFRQAGANCSSARSLAASAGPGAQGLLDTCTAFTLILQSDPQGCSRLRMGVAGLFGRAADNGPFAPLLPSYRASATKMLTEGACAL